MQPIPGSPGTSIFAPRADVPSFLIVISRSHGAPVARSEKSILRPTIEPRSDLRERTGPSIPRPGPTDPEPGDDQFPPHALGTQPHEPRLIQLEPTQPPQRFVHPVDGGGRRRSPPRRRSAGAGDTPDRTRAPGAPSSGHLPQARRVSAPERPRHRCSGRAHEPRVEFPSHAGRRKALESLALAAAFVAEKWTKRRGKNLENSRDQLLQLKIIGVLSRHWPGQQSERRFQKAMFPGSNVQFRRRHVPHRSR